MRRYLVLIEPAARGFSAYSPDLLGCIATGKTQVQVEKRIKEAISFHIDGLKKEGIRPPLPKTSIKYVTA